MVFRSRYIDPQQPYRGGKLLGNLVLFGRLCRRLGLGSSPGRMIEAERALTMINLGSREEVYYALRSLLVTRKSQIPVFDRAFRSFWRELRESWSELDLRSLGESQQRREVRVLPRSVIAGEDEEEGDDGSERDLVPTPLPSHLETLRRKDFSEMSPQEIEEARRLLPVLDLRAALRKSRRRRLGRGHELDVRRLMHETLRQLGEPLKLPRRVRRLRPRPLTLICDISGSMESYTRILLHFMHALMSGDRKIECFVFSTRLTRVTLPLRRRSIDRALREVGSGVKDWGGGTRIGEALRVFNYRWARRVLGRGASVLLISDAWDRGDPDLLSREASRLRRSCRRLIWLNPLLGRPGYQPLTRGAKALLPHCHESLPVHNLVSLEQLADALEGLGAKL